MRIAVASAVAGIGGYVITTIVARGLGETGYSVFALFWAALYLVIGALAGVQQEVARATRPDPDPDGARPLTLAVVLATSVLVLLSSTAPLWGPLAFPAEPTLALPVAVGCATYIFVAVFSGGLYGLALWRPLAVVIVLDVALRLGGIGAGLALGADATALAWLTVAPFAPVAAVAVLGAGRRVINARLDVRFGAALGNIGRTVAAAAATAVLVSGFPLLIGLSAHNVSAASLSALIFALTLTRAPLVVSALALQSYLVVHFRDRADVARRLTLYCGIIVATAGVFSLAVLVLGEPVFLLLTAWGGFALSGAQLALLVLSSVPTAVLAVVGSAVLARSAHTAYSLSWILSAIVAMLLLFLLPVDLLTRVLLALSLGPLVGLAVLLVELRRR